MLRINKSFFVWLINEADEVAGKSFTFESTVPSVYVRKFGLLADDAEQSVATIKVDGDMFARIEIGFEFLCYVND